MHMEYLPGRTLIDVGVARECPKCHVARYYFVNERGGTTCLMCATVRETEGL